MDNVLSGLSWEVCLYYLDDITVFSKDWKEHLQHLRIVFSRLRDANLRLGHKKCTLAKSSVTFLGHLVSEDGLQPDPSLIESIREIQPPVNVSQVRSFLGLMGYYRRFIKGDLQNSHTFKQIAGEKQTILLGRRMYGSLRTTEDIAPTKASGSIPRFFRAVPVTYGCIQC